MPTQKDSRPNGVALTAGGAPSSRARWSALHIGSKKGSHDPFSYKVETSTDGSSWLALGSLTDTITAKDAQIVTVTTQRDFFSKAVSDRNALIGVQNASIDALANAAVADRTAF